MGSQRVGYNWVIFPLACFILLLSPTFCSQEFYGYPHLTDFKTGALETKLTTGQSLDFNLERFPTPESSRRTSDTVFTWSYLSQSRKLRILFPQTNRKQWCLFSQHVDLGVLGSWAQALPRGSLVLFLWVAPLRWSRSASSSLTSSAPWSCEQQQLPGWSLSPPSLWTPPWTGQKWGDVIATRTCLGTRGRGVVT